MSTKQRCSILGCEAFATEKHHVLRPTDLQIWVCMRHHGQLHGAEWDNRHSVLIRAGLAKAKAAGRLGGNPGLQSPEGQRTVRVARAAKDFAKLVAGSEEWLPLASNLRAAGKTWTAVAKAISEKLSVQWTSERTRRSVTRLVAAGLAHKSLLKQAPPARGQRHPKLPKTSQPGLPF